jgi:hypothetical protein
MSVFTDYFVAASDDIAATVIDDGPVGHPGIGSVAESTSIDPVVALGTLEELVTGVSFDTLLADSSQDAVAERDGGERLVMTVRPGIVEALASRDEAEMRSFAQAWSETEELVGFDATTLEDFIGALASLAREATSGGGRVYCWICV